MTFPLFLARANIDFLIAREGSNKLRAMMNIIIHHLYPTMRNDCTDSLRKQVILDLMSTFRSGSIKLQQILIGALFYIHAIPRTVWRLLTKLRIAPNENFMKKWLSTKQMNELPTNMTQVFGIDTTYLTTYHSIKAAKVHPLTVCLTFAINIPWLMSDTLFQSYSMETFTERINHQVNGVDCFQQWYIICSQKLSQTSKISHPTSPCQRSDKHQHPGMAAFKYGMDSKKISEYGDVEELILSLYQYQRNVKNPYPVFIYGDWEYYSKIIKLSGQNTNIVPVLAA